MKRPAASRGSFSGVRAGEKASKTSRSMAAKESDSHAAQLAKGLLGMRGAEAKRATSVKGSRLHPVMAQMPFRGERWSDSCDDEHCSGWGEPSEEGGAVDVATGPGVTSSHGVGQYPCVLAAAAGSTSHEDYDSAQDDDEQPEQQQQHQQLNIPAAPAAGGLAPM